MNTIWFSPPILFVAFLLLGGLLLLLSKRIAAQGDDNPSKHMHYSCGEDLDVPHFELDYHAFFPAGIAVWHSAYRSIDHINHLFKRQTSHKILCCFVCGGCCRQYVHIVGA